VRDSRHPEGKLAPGELARVRVLIPARDEESALPRVLAGLRREGVLHVVVVDNGSRDGTARAAREGGATVVSEPRKGYGRACLTGLRFLGGETRAESAPPPVVLFMDGDGSDDPAGLHALLAPIFRGEAEMTVGRRVGSPDHEAPGGDGEPGKRRARLGTGLVLFLARLLHGLEARDLGPFRAVRWDLLQRLEMDDPTWGWTLQMQLRAFHLGARVGEVPVPAGRRRGGTSKVSGSLWMSARVGSRMIWTLLREWVRARRRRRRPGGNLPGKGSPNG
jgi:glycosyltransferase involved in cell wall biosynthesis